MDARFSLQEVAEKLNKHRFNTLVFETAEEVRAWFAKDFPQVQTVGRGGSVTLDQLGVPQILADRGIELYYHADAKTAEEKEELFKKANSAEIYLASANAVLATGEIFNVDGAGNRVSALAYGPKESYLVVGRNKIVADIDEALKRLQEVASPQNVARLQYPAGCLKTGKCIDCNAPKRICNVYTVMARAPWLVKTNVILVNEDLGY